MTEEVAIRKSIRLKDKPTPEYAYRNYLKVDNDNNEEDRLKKDYLPPAVIETNKKYDDLFDSVVTNAFLLDVQKTPDQFFAEKRALEPSTPTAVIIPAKKSRGPRGPYKKRPKPSSDPSSDNDDVIILESSLSAIKNQMRRMKGSLKRQETNPRSIRSIEQKLEKVEKLVKKIEDLEEKKDRIQENREVQGEPKIKEKEMVSEEIPMDIGSSSSSSCSSDIEIVEEVAAVPRVFPCSCGKVFERHDDAHEHLFNEHSDCDELADCVQCGFRLEEIRTNHVCHVCHKFVIDLEQHLIVHYRTCSGRDPVMECRFCTRQFKTVRETMAHEQAKHISKPTPRRPYQYKCNECSVSFTSPDHLTTHYGNHLEMNSFCDKIEELQNRNGAIKEECPYCGMYLSSPKNFRSHLFKWHWPECKRLGGLQETTNYTMSDREIKQEILEMTKEIEMKEVKKEVKEEMEDDGYPLC